MGEKVERLVELARVYVPPHVAVVGGKTIHVAGYTRTVQSGFRSSVAAGGGGTYGEGGMGPARRIEVVADENRLGRPKVSGPVLSWTQDDGVELERGTAYTWDMGGVTYTGTFSGIHGGSESTANDRAIMRDVDATYPNGATKTHEQFYAPRSGVRSLEEVDKEVREAAYKQDISPVEYLRTKMSRIELAQTRVSQYLRKGETGEIEDVASYIRSGVPSGLKKGGLKKRAGQPSKKTEFFGRDRDGTEIKMGSAVLVTAGPDKGLRGTVVGRAKGGSVKVREAGKLGKSLEPGKPREPVLVDPDELRVATGTTLEAGHEVPPEPEDKSKRPPQPRWKQPRPKETAPKPGKVTVKKGTPAATPTGEFLGSDEDGNDIKTGSSVVVEAGPDKGLRGIVRGESKGGGIQVEVQGNLGKRTVLVQPEELRVKGVRRSYGEAHPYSKKNTIEALQRQKLLDKKLKSSGSSWPGLK